MNSSTRQISWFGKLPCVGDFCSHNMSSTLLQALDDWLSKAMQQGQDAHGSAWMQAYFQTPVHGFIWAQNVLPELNGDAAIGLIMPSVDKAGRAFPFMLIERLPLDVLCESNRAQISIWFAEAHALCSDTLNEEWSLSKLEAELMRLPKLHKQADMRSIVPPACSDWFRIEFDGHIKPVVQCTGLPTANEFDMLLGLSAAT